MVFYEKQKKVLTQEEVDKINKEYKDKIIKDWLAEGRSLDDLHFVDEETMWREKRKQQAIDIDDVRSGRKTLEDMMIFSPKSIKKIKIDWSALV